MKIFEQITIVIIIVIFVITLDIITSKITEKCINNMKKEINEVSKLIDKNINEANKKSDNLVNDWKKYEKKMNYYLEHDEIEKVTNKIILLKSQLEIKDIDYAKQNIAELEFLLNHIEEKTKLRINNIF